jgi:glycosyltransferase involved in cell wall biosynthesis
LRLLQVTGTLNPAYGGPPAVLNELTYNVRALGHMVDVLTLDDPSSSWLCDIPGHVFALGGRGNYRYSAQLKSWLLRHSAEYDAIVVHGIWQYQSRVAQTACRETAVPYFVFTHGALNPWFQRNYPVKHVKKSLYWRLFEYRSLRDARAVFFTCEEERRLARTSFKPYKVTEEIVGVGINDPLGDPTEQREAFLSMHPNLRGKRILLFMGRLHEVKGCDLLIRAFDEASRNENSLQLVIAGPDEADTAAALRSLSSSLGLNARITWTGMLRGDAKWGAFRSADAFVLTSHSESFGMVVVEALACGVPVLISNGVNIWREIVNCNAGLVEDPTVVGAKRLLNRWLNLPTAERESMRKSARQCFVENFEARAAATDFVQAIARATGKRGGK